jgi:hypothetical protein
MSGLANSLESLQQIIKRSYLLQQIRKLSRIFAADLQALESLQQIIKGRL